LKLSNLTEKQAQNAFHKQIEQNKQTNPKKHVKNMPIHTKPTS